MFYYDMLNNSVTGLISVLFHFGYSAVQVSIGYFLSDLAMILYNYPALGGTEYVSI